MKWTTLTFKQLAAQRTLRMDPKYWIKKKKRKVRASSFKQQGTSNKLQASSTTNQGGRVGPQATSNKQLDKSQGIL